MCPKDGNWIDLWTSRSVTWDYSKEYLFFFILLLLLLLLFCTHGFFFWTLIQPQKTYNPIPGSSIKLHINNYMSLSPFKFFSYAFLMPIVGSYFNIHGLWTQVLIKCANVPVFKHPAALWKQCHPLQRPPWTSTWRCLLQLPGMVTSG